MSQTCNTSTRSFALALPPGLDGAAALLGRVMIAALFVLSGFQKLSNPQYIIGYIASVGLPLPELGLIIALGVEVVVSLALIGGWRTHLAATIMAAFSIATAAFFHANFADQNQLIHFLKNIAIAGGLLQIAAFGGGRLSLDALFQSRAARAS